MQFDIAFTSVLKRAIETLWLVLEELDQVWIPVERSWRLNERHYGGLQGKNKSQTAAEFGAEQVHQWRRSFNTRPPGRRSHEQCQPIKLGLLPVGGSRTKAVGQSVS